MSSDLMSAAAGDDPAEGLHAVRSLRVLADRLEASNAPAGSAGRGSTSPTCSA